MSKELKIYFFGSIWGADNNSEIIRGLLTHLKTKGKVLSEHLFTEEYKNAEHLDVRGIHDRDSRWVEESNVMVGDVTAPSLGVGYEIKDGIYQKKPILALYDMHRKGKLSAMIDGSPEIVVKRYWTLKQANKLIDFFFRDRLNIK